MTATMIQTASAQTQATTQAIVEQIQQATREVAYIAEQAAEKIATAKAELRAECDTLKQVLAWGQTGAADILDDLVNDLFAMVAPTQPASDLLGVPATPAMASTPEAPEVPARPDPWELPEETTPEQLPAEEEVAHAYAHAEPSEPASPEPTPASPEPTPAVQEPSTPNEVIQEPISTPSEVVQEPSTPSQEEIVQTAANPSTVAPEPAPLAPVREVAQESPESLPAPEVPGDATEPDHGSQLPTLSERQVARMRKAELREAAQARGVHVEDDATKSDLVRALEAAGFIVD
jgi:hypothetical protein